jgi:hypothetical protein
MRLKSAVAKILTNKWVLNIVAFLSLLNVIGYLILGNLNAVLFFILLAVLIRYFSKNMIIVLGVPLLLVNLLVSRISTTEGFDGESSNSANSKQDNGKKDKKDHKKMIKQINDQASKRHGSLVTTPLDTQQTMDDKNETDHDSSNSDNTDGFEPGRQKNRGFDIDYATTVEDAYDELNKILGSDGIHRLTSDTQNLMKQQMQLAEAMKGMGPIIQGMAPMLEQAKSMMDGMSNGKNGLSGVVDMANKLTNGISAKKV